MEESFARLFQSSDLGVVTANLEQVLDANDAFLRMIGYTRDEFTALGLDWRKMTPPECTVYDDKAIDQLCTHGVAVPYEKAFILRNGNRVEFIIGAVRLSETPLRWACYVIDRTEIQRLREAEHELRARTRIINQLAHELNNPLAALTFLLHLASTEQDMLNGHCELLKRAEEQLGRVSETVRRVLAETEAESRSGA